MPLAWPWATGAYHHDLRAPFAFVLQSPTQGARSSNACSAAGVTPSRRRAMGGIRGPTNFDKQLLTGIVAPQATSVVDGVSAQGHAGRGRWAVLKWAERAL
jgi:hypothetical protein